MTCQAQPALGMVYKLVSVGGQPRIKLSEEVEKTTLPGTKVILRVYLESPDVPSFDVLCLEGEQ